MRDSLTKRTFFWISVLILVTTWFFLLLGNVPAIGLSGGQPKAVIPETSHDFGEIFQDRELSHTFTIKNTGDAPLKILEVDPDCACTVFSYDREIPPGKEGKITLKIKPYSLRKKFRKKTKIRFNDPDNRKAVLVMSGYSRPIIEIIPSHIVRFKGGVDERHEAEIKFISHLPEPWEIKTYKTNIPDKIEVILTPTDPGRVYVVTVRNRLQEPGRYAGKIYLMTTAKKRPRLLVRVFADLSLEWDTAKP